MVPRSIPLRVERRYLEGCLGGRTRRCYQMRFILLLYGDETAELALTPDERRAIVGRHIEFAARLRDRGAMLGGDPLQSSTEGAVVRGGRVTDGPFAETKEQIGGYYLIECADRDEAIEYARQVPDSPGLAVEVRQLAEM
jgi:hypothetical protein